MQPTAKQKSQNLSISGKVASLSNEIEIIKIVIVDLKTETFLHVMIQPVNNPGKTNSCHTISFLEKCVNLQKRNIIHI